jgi:light-regulated signal transduction histidine kinase (bacteriophytochrome)
MSSAALLWVHAAGNVLIAIGCFIIAALFGHVARKRRDVAFPATVACSAFLFCCGLISLMAAWNLWHADVALEGAVKLLAAAIAIVAVVLFLRHLKAIVSTPNRMELRDANEALARANRELEIFTASVAHDLRSPLTTIAGQAGLLEMSAGPKLDDDQKRRLQRIHASVKQMSELIEALLNLSRISRQSLAREPIDLSAMAEQILSELVHREPARKVEVRIAPALKVHADAQLLLVVMTNLLENAWKFTARKDSACIEVGSELDANEPCIYVRDNGAGFDMAHKDKLFQPFQRLHLQSEFPGSGMGLATASRIVARHGGRIAVEAKPGEGAKVWFTVGG